MVWSSTGTWSTYSPSSPPSSWSSSTSTPLGWSTTSERFPWRLQKNPQNFQSPPFLGAVQRLRAGRRRWDDRKASSGDAWTRATGQNHNSKIPLRNVHLDSKLEKLVEDFKSSQSSKGCAGKAGTERSPSRSSRKGPLLVLAPGKKSSTTLEYDRMTFTLVLILMVE